jgi:hypothetical protein
MIFHYFDMTTSSLNFTMPEPTISASHWIWSAPQSATLVMAMDQATTSSLPAPVVIEDTLPPVYSPPLSNKTVENDTESQEPEHSSTDEDWDSDDDSDDDVFVDALEYIPEDPLPKKNFPDEAGTLLYGALKTHIDDRDMRSCSPSSSDSLESGDGVFSASSRRTSMTQRSNRWSIDTMYTASTRSALSDVGSLSGGSVRSTGTIPHPLRPAPEIPGAGSVDKGIPWGLHGRDYVAPSLKRHKLRETLRDKPRPKTSVFSRFTTRVGNMFRRFRPIQEVKQAKRRFLIE